MTAAAFAPVAQWQVHLEGGDWQPFSIAGSLLAEEAYKSYRSAGASEVRIWSGQFEYSVDFGAMKQTNCTSGKTRRLRRREFVPAEEAAALKAEMDRLRKERDALAAERRASQRFELAPRSDLALALHKSMADRMFALPTYRSMADRILALRKERDDALAAERRASQRMESVPRRGLAVALDESMADRIFALPTYRISVEDRVAWGCAGENLSKSDPRHQWLKALFLSSWRQHRRAYDSTEWCPEAKVEVHELWEVYNDVAAAGYRQELARMCEKRPRGGKSVPELKNAVSVRTSIGGQRLNEALLYHGCSLDTYMSILREGFDARLGGGSVGQAFGIGTYFTTLASKADFYTSSFSSSRRRVMLGARVALGEVHEQMTYDTSLRRPPGDCDSVLGVPRSRGGCVDHDEFIIYKLHQAIPQFVYVYSHQPDCRCRTCVNA